jgi:NADH-quinone oxidoreductase subunit H
MSCINVILFLGGWLPLPFIKFLPNILNFTIKVVFMVFIFILIRAMLPRYRYDQLMNLGWKVFLPLSLGFFIFYSGVFLGLDFLP